MVGASPPLLVATCARHAFPPRIPALTLSCARRLTRARAAGLDRGEPGPGGAVATREHKISPSGPVAAGRDGEQQAEGHGVPHSVAFGVGVPKVESPTGRAGGGAASITRSGCLLLASPLPALASTRRVSARHRGRQADLEAETRRGAEVPYWGVRRRKGTLESKLTVYC